MLQKDNPGYHKAQWKAKNKYTKKKWGNKIKQRKLFTDFVFSPWYNHRLEMKINHQAHLGRLQFLLILQAFILHLRNAIPQLINLQDQTLKRGKEAHVKKIPWIIVQKYFTRDLLNNAQCKVPHNACSSIVKASTVNLSHCSETIIQWQPLPFSTKALGW